MQPVIRRYLDHPMVRYLIVAVFSTLASIIFFALGGSLASVSNNEGTLLGFSFQASGAIGGFVLIFFASLKALERLTPPGEPTLQVRVYLVGIPEGFSREEDYTCQGRIFNGETGEKREFTSQPRWEIGYFTIDFHDVGSDDFVGARIHNGGKVWQLDDFLPLVSERKAELLRVAYQLPEASPLSQDENGTNGD